jgi:hypothetical protein
MGQPDHQLKDEVLRRIDDERAAWQALVAEVGPDRVEQPGAMGEWTFRDLASHLTGWRSYGIARIEAFNRGEGDAPFPWPPTLTEDDEINDWIREEDQGRPAQEVIAAHDATFPRLRAAIEAMDNAQLANLEALPWLEGQSLGEVIRSGSFFDHFHQEHEPEVRAWLASAAR